MLFFAKSYVWREQRRILTVAHMTRMPPRISSASSKQGVDFQSNTLRHAHWHPTSPNLPLHYKISRAIVNQLLMRRLAARNVAMGGFEPEWQMALCVWDTVVLIISRDLNAVMIYLTASEVSLVPVL